MIGAFVVTVPLPPLYAAMLCRVVGARLPHFYAVWALTATGAALGALCGAAWGWAGVAAANAVLAALLWWLSRRRRRKAPRSLGAKSRALVAAMVAKLRESLKPHPVLRPVPGGAS